MKDSGYLVFNEKRLLRFKNLKGGSPKLDSGEFAIKINLEIPKDFFEKYLPIANIKVNEENILKPEINVEERKSIFDLALGEIQ